MSGGDASPDVSDSEVDDDLAEPRARVMPGDWEVLPFKKPASAAWDMVVPHSELSKLLNGFCSGDMDDKWFVCTLGPDAQGNVVVHMHRSWTGYKGLELRVQVPVDEHGQPKEEDSRVTELIWEAHGHDDVPEDEDEASTKEAAEAIIYSVLRVKLKKGSL